MDGYESSRGPGRRDDHVDATNSEPGQESARPEPPDEQIMSKLPRSRPQRAGSGKIGLNDREVNACVMTPGKFIAVR